MTRKRILLDTNVLISALIFGGKPREILRSVIEKKLIAVTSQVLLAELSDILSKKFKFTEDKIRLLIEKIKKTFVVVYPTVAINILSDDPDNRVLEAGVEGDCSYIITGDKGLLGLSKYKNIEILNPSEFLAS